MAHITLNTVNKYFGEPTDPKSVHAVKDLSLEIPDGEFLVLLGPSGCGKTTTLRMVAGLETVTAGEVFIGDRLVNELEPGDRDIAFVFQFYALYPHLSVKDNISFPLRAQRMPKQVVEERVQRIAETLQIDHVLNRRPGKLPSGEQQRVALGRAMVREPQVFLMDEPLTNLDAALRADMRVELKHLQQELGTTMLYVTHDQVEAMSMGHRIAVMDKGVLQQVGTPLEIYNSPQTLFVATFIGSPPMNTVTCRYQPEAGALHALSSDFRLTVSDSRLGQVSNGHDLVFGMRSEDIAICEGEETGDLSGEVLIREPLGDETIYDVDVGGESFLVKTSPRQRYQPGDTVALKFNRERVHLFDHATGRAL